MDKHFVSSSAVQVDNYSEWLHVENSEIDNRDDQVPKPASTDKHAPSEVEGDFCLLDLPHPSQGGGKVPPKPINQPSFIGGIWSSTSSLGTQLISGGDSEPTLPPPDEHTQHDMASNDQEERKPKTGRGIFTRLRTAWRSEDAEKVYILV